MDTLRLGTRSSLLALWQANYIKDILEKNNYKIEIVTIKTKGDVILDKPLSKIGGKGLFTKELEIALLDNAIDFAVHSLKDVPVVLPPNLELVAITKREDVRDCFLSYKFKDIFDLPKNAKVGTTSLRRAMQIMRIRNDLQVLNLRGNVITRLKKLENAQYDAIILAQAALKRLQIGANYNTILDSLIPAMGQGALGIECRSNDEKTKNILKILNDEESNFCTTIEREFILNLGGGCQSPIGAYCEKYNDNFKLTCAIGNLDGSKFIKKDIILHDDYKKELYNFIEDLKKDGALEILKQVKEQIEKIQGDL